MSSNHKLRPPGPATRQRAALSAQQPWQALLWQRARYLFWLKFLGVSAFMALFFVGYFQTLRHPAYPVALVPLTWLDHAIGFEPGWLPVYGSLWLYVGIAPGLMGRLRELLAYGAWAAVLSIAGLLIFHFFPTAVPPLQSPLNLAEHPLFAVLHGLDAAGNALPSLHVATALFTALWVQRILRGLAAPAWLAALSWLWFGLIFYSTLAIKQHLLWDGLAGAGLGLVVAWASMRWFPSGGAPRAP